MKARCVRWLIVLSCLLVVLCLFAVHRRGNSKINRSGTLNGKDSEQAGVINRKDLEQAAVIHKELKEVNRTYYVDSAGISTFLSSNYTDDTPLIEVNFLQKDAAGQSKPLRVYSFSLQGPNWNKTYVVNGSGFRMEVGSTHERDRRFISGERYIIPTYSPFGEGTLHQHKSTMPLMPSFSIPDNPAPGAIYVVSLLLEDALLRQQLMTQKENEKRTHQLLCIISELPAMPVEGTWIMEYHDGQAIFQLGNITPGEVRIKNVVNLRGELVIRYHTNEGYDLPWVYLNDVQKRHLSAPQDFDRVYSSDSYFIASFEFDQKAISNNLATIAFFYEAKSDLPVFGYYIKEGSTPLKNVRCVPGTFYVKGYKESGQSLDFGKIAITNNKSNYILTHNGR